MYKALIIDDVALVREAVQMLGQWDMFEITEIYEAENAQEGLALIHDKKPDIIITDMKMPIMDGTVLLQHLNDEHIPGKIIVISGFSDFEYTHSAIKSGVIDYILKPIDPQDLNNALAEAVEQLEREASGSPTSAAVAVPAGNTTVQKIEAYLRQNYTADISLADLAGRFFLSKEHLSRLFKKETGRNLFAYIMELKLTEAKRLLSETDRTIDDIAFSLGFSNGNYFSKVFKKNLGISPGNFRKK